MFQFFRATGITAAISAVVLGAFYAGPTRALETPSAPISASYIDHMTASVSSGDVPLNDIGPAETLDQATSALTHAVASVPDVIESAGPAPASRSLGDLVGQHGSADTVSQEQECLAGAVYFEAKGEPLQGQLSVAEVVLNRSRSGRFPSSICGVVKQRGQFSFVRSGQFPPIARASAAWRKAVAIAHIAEQDLADSPVSKALFFHAKRVSPGWRGLTRIASVGNHVFYR